MARGSSSMGTSSGESARRASGVVREGPRVFIRYPRASDEAEFVRVREASWTSLRPWEPTAPGRDEPDPDQSRTFERILLSSNTTDSQRFFICLKNPPTGAGATGHTPTATPTASTSPAPAPIIGQVSLNHIGYGALMGATTGYWMSSAYEGNGLMAEGLSLALDVAFEHLELHRVEANIIPRNARSIALVTRLGFRYEGLAKQLVRINGVWEDHGRYAMLAEDWKGHEGLGTGQW